MEANGFPVVIINGDRDRNRVFAEYLSEINDPRIVVEVADTGEAGVLLCLDRLRSGRGCAIVASSLPDMTGMQVLDRFRDEAGEVRLPVVMLLNSRNGQGPGRTLLRAGALEWLFDSQVTVHTLVDAVENAAERFELLKRDREKRSALHQGNQRFHAIIETLPDVIARFDAELRCTDANAAIETAWGYSPNTLLGKTSREAGLPEKLCEFWETRLVEAFQRGKELGFHFLHEWLDSPRSYRTRLIPERGTAGKVESVVMISTEVVGPDENGREAVVGKDSNPVEHTDIRRTEFIGMLAHELRNPLAAISTAVHVMKLRGPAQPELEWGRDVIGRQVKQLSRLIDDLLDVSRLASGRLVLKTCPIDVREVITQAAEFVQPLMSNREHDFRVELSSDPLPAHADPARLEQVVANLLTNAAKFTEPGGKITVTANCENDKIVIRVRDNGNGIAPELKPVIFDLFSQINPSPDRAQGGLGIGLTLVKSLAAMHDGTVEVASEGLGHGSEFIVRIPADKKQ